MALAAVGDTLVLSSPDANEQAGYSAFDFVLGSSYLTPSDAKQLTSAKSLNLKSIAIIPAKTWYHNSAKGAGLAIYRKTSAKAWSYVGRSDWQKDYTINGTAKVAFNFDNLELSPRDQYTAVFYANEAAFNALSGQSTLNSLLGEAEPTAKKPIVVMGMKSVNVATADFSMYGRDGKGRLVERPQSPCVTFSATPATSISMPFVIAGVAAIAMLALLGLLMYRRGK